MPSTPPLRKSREYSPCEFSVRRLHDIGKSGWYMFLSLIPLIGGLILLIWSLMDSEPGENQYGKNPKEGKEQQ